MRPRICVSSSWPSVPSHVLAVLKRGRRAALRTQEHQEQNSRVVGSLKAGELTIKSGRIWKATVIDVAGAFGSGSCQELPRAG